MVPTALPEAIVVEVLRRTESGQSRREIAGALKIGTTTIGLIRAGRHWTARSHSVSA